VAAAGQTLAPSTSASGVDLQAIDKAANPCGDFYQFACGTWIKTHPIPPDESTWGTFDLLIQRNQETLRDILQDAEQHQNRSANDQKVGGFYHSCMDETEIAKGGTAPLQPELARISHVSTPQELLDEIARLQSFGIDVFFSFSPEPDPKDARMEIAALDQGGLGLPERDYYFRTDEKSEEIRRKYVAHIEKMFELMGVPAAEAAKKASTVMSIETDLARNSLDVTTRRDPQRLVHEVPTSELTQLTPGFSFTAFFTRVEAPAFSKLNVAVPDFFKGLNVLLEHQTMNGLKDYLTWHWVSESAALLPKAFDQANFDFYGRVLTGAQQQRPRWKRCVNATDRQLGEALGRAYAEKTFGEQGKQRTLAMVRQIEQEMGKDIESLSWMTPETKQQALIKLRAVANKIGYPDKWRDYSSVEIRDNDYFGNTYRAQQFEVKRQINKIGKPVDKAEWEMTPPTVNAYYEPTENNINFPAGILQPPFYSNKADDSVNYGAVGVVIGHELTHGFDDQGRQYDADGNLKDWWQKSDGERFKQLADCFVKEYNGFSPVPDVHLKGELTLGENTADNGGIRLAYQALLDDLATKGEPLSSKQDSYTQPQQFFLGYAQLWCENVRPEMARMMAQTDPHSPGKFRVIGVLQNMPQFSEAFGCKPGDAMYVAPGRGCRVW